MCQINQQPILYTRLQFQIDVIGRRFHVLYDSGSDLHVSIKTYKIFQYP